MKGKQFGALAGSIVCLVVCLVVAVMLKVMSLGDIPSAFIGAALGAVISAVITMMLLQGQTAAEEDKDRNVEVFKEKSMVFQEYIKPVWGIWEDQKVTSEEFKLLTTGYYRDLMIYLDDNKVFQTKDKTEKPSELVTGILNKSEGGKPSLIIAKAIEKIGGCLDGKCLDKADAGSVKTLRESITLIINVLSDQIGLGGQIKPSIIEKHEEQMFPVFFRETLLESLTKALSTQNPDTFIQSKYEINFADDGEVAAFYFKKFPDCRIVIGPIAQSDWSRLEIHLFVPWNYKNVYKFREQKSGRFGFRMKKSVFEQYDLRNPVPVDKEDEREGKNSEKYQKRLLFQNEHGLKLDEPNAINEYRMNYHEVSGELARRAAYYFREIEIPDGQDSLSIPEFLEHYLGGN
jgi:hypothetical protein